MSRYSNKCDLCDWIDIRDDMDYTLNKTTYYVGWHNYMNHNPLPVGSIRSLMPYFAHIVILGSCNQEHSTVVLTERSYVDIEEEEHINWVFKDILDYYKRCKRRKIEWTEDSAWDYYHMHSIFSYDEPIAKEIIHRVAEYGLSADIDGIHLPSFDSMRNDLNELMAQYDKEHKE